MPHYSNIPAHRWVYFASRQIPAVVVTGPLQVFRYHGDKYFGPKYFGTKYWF